MEGSDATSITSRAYDRQAEGYDRRWANYLARSTDLTLRALPVLPVGARVLDLGCGTGQLLAMLRTHRPDLILSGADVSAAMLKQAVERLGDSVELHRVKAEELAFDDGSFDAVVTVSSMHHWQKPQRGLAQVARVLDAQGVLVLTDWCRESWRMRLMDLYLRFRDPSHQRALSQSELAAEVQGAGFVVQSQMCHQIDRLWLLQTLVARRGGHHGAQNNNSAEPGLPTPARP